MLCSFHKLVMLDDVNEQRDLKLNKPLVLEVMLLCPLSKLIVDGDDKSFCSQAGLSSCLRSSAGP